MQARGVTAGKTNLMQKALMLFIVILPYMIFIIMSLGVFLKPIEDGDELWNYNFARNIHDGRLPYLDFNMVQTPLAAYISGFFLKIFGNTLQGFRFVSAIFLATTFSILYNLCKKITNNSIMAWVSASYAFALNFIVWVYNYNNLNLLLLLIILCLEYRIISSGSTNSYKYDLLVGLLVGMMPLIKQSTGIVFILTNTILCFVSVAKDRSLLRAKVHRWLVSFVPIIAFTIFMVINGSIYEFIDYAILGIGEFTHRTSYFEFILSSPVAFLLGIFPVITIALYINSKIAKRASSQVYLTFFAFSIAGLSVAFPLCDYVHFIVAIVPFIPCLLLLYNPRPVKLFEKAICCTLPAIVLVGLVISVYPSADSYKLCSVNKLEGLPIDIDLENNIKTLVDYIKAMEEDGYSVVVADEYGIIYMIPLERCNKDFDMLLVGNIGKKTVQDLLEQNKSDIILVRGNNSTLGYQAHYEFIDEVKSKYRKIGEVSSFYAYYKR